MSESDLNLYGWSNVAQVGRAGAVTALQWTRVPVSIAATNIDLVTRDVTNESGAVVSTVADYDIQAFLVPANPAETYGNSPVITARTVAFGGIPTEVDLQLRQVRDEDDLPVGLRIRPTYTVDFIQDKEYYPPTVLKADVELAVVGLRIDGVTIALTGTCSTGPSAALDIASEDITIDKAAGENFDQDVGFSGVDGGTLNGTLDIPGFSGCLTSDGDDVSPILTSTISGNGNPVSIKIGILGCISRSSPEGFPLPPAPGTPISQSGCPPDLSEQVEGVPSPLPFPDYAPGATAP